jgi:hypothetical protein
MTTVNKQTQETLKRSQSSSLVTVLWP